MASSSPARCILALTVLLAGVSAAHAALIVTDQDQRVMLGRHSEILEDPDGALGIEQVSGPAMAHRFERVTRDTVNRATVRGVFWLKVPIEYKPAPGGNRTPQWVLEIAYPSLETVTLFLPAGGGGWIVTQAGEALPYAVREILHRNPVFAVPLPRDRPVTIFIRAAVEKVMVLPPVLWQREAFVRAAYTEQLIHGLYFGIILVMVLYNLFVFISLRDPSYAFYVLYTASFGLFQFSFTGLAFEYLWPEAPAWNSMANVVLVFVSFSFAMQFSRHYLLMGRHWPLLARIMDGLTAVGVLCAGLTVFVDRTMMTHASNLLPACGVVVFIAVGVLALRRKSRAARYFLVAWGAYIVGVTLFILKNLGVLPANIITMYDIQAGSAIEIILFSLGLADRINELRREREQSQQRLLTIQHEMDVAQRIQNSLLPGTIPRLAGAAITVRYAPARCIGGDYYDFAQTGPSSCGVLIADTSGHGIPAAIISSALRLSFHEQRKITHRPPALIRGMNEMLIGNIGNQYITAGYVFVDLAAMTAQYVNAGHQPLCIVDRADGAIRQVSPKGIILGWRQFDDFELCEFPLAQNQRLIFITDGYVECRNGAGELFGHDRLVEAFRELRALPPDECIDALDERISAWNAGRDEFEDDRTILIIDIE
ncbi:MAG TPA: 7TM diverse intracellular signaling domain-containing protein [Spirochaetota bacterium]|nr:7TM diverse intracellular signaling domain-containing protein [Spirochaetota bacterium]